MNDNEKNALIAQCLEDFRRPVGPEYIIKNSAEYSEYLVCIYKILDQILRSNQNRIKENILKCINILIWIIILCGLIVGFFYLINHNQDWIEKHLFWNFVLTAIFYMCIVPCIGAVISCCYGIIHFIKDKYYNIYHLIDEQLYDSYEYNNTLAEICYIQKFRHSRHATEEKRYCYPYNKKMSYSPLNNIDIIEFMILADTKRFAYSFKGISNNTSNKNFLELPHDEIIKKYEEEIYSKEKAPIPESFFSN